MRGRKIFNYLERKKFGGNKMFFPQGNKTRLCFHAKTLKKKKQHVQIWSNDLTENIVRKRRALHESLNFVDLYMSKKNHTGIQGPCLSARQNIGVYVSILHPPNPESLKSGG